MKVYLDTVGCRLNQAEIEIMAREFREAGHEIVAGAENAQVAVLNTCAVTSAAVSDSRQKIRGLRHQGALEIVATGCWATLQPASVAGLPGVSRVVMNDAKDRLVPLVLGLPERILEVQPRPRAPLPGARRRTRAFIKVQDGCNNHCTFCVTTIARGAGRSRLISEVVRDVRSALDGGTHEIVLTGVHLASWGQEYGLKLKDLVREILSATRISRLRLSSLEPWDLDADFFSLWHDPRLCPHVHLPLQSGCAATLKRMARKIDPLSFRQLVADARQIIPEMAITTDLIAGFPGETDADFDESLAFVRDMEFAGGHVFGYSPRPETSSARMKEQIPPHVRRRRAHVYQAQLEAAASAYRLRMIGGTRSVLWESSTCTSEGGWELEGLTDNYVRVAAKAAASRWNQVDTVRLTKAEPNHLIGSILKSG